MGALFSRRSAAVKQLERHHIVLSSRAEAWLQLGRYDIALRDAESALAIRATDARSLWRKGRALLGLDDYAAACAAFKQALEHSEPGTRGAIRESYQQSILLKEQSVTGSYDISALLGSKVKLPVANFVGPVMIKMSRKCDGMGLFLTRNVKAGEVLLVSKSIACEKDEPEIHKRAAKLATACIGSPKIHQQVSLLGSDHKILSKNNATLITPFQPNSSIGQHNPTQVDLDKVYTVVQNLADCSLPYCINHSCCPNVCCFLINAQSATFVVAARDLQAGQELLRNYTDCFNLGECLRFGFHCDRCMLQQRPPFDKVAERYQQLVLGDDDGDDDASGNHLADLVDVARALEVMMIQEGDRLNADEKMQLRCIYFGAYRAYYTCWKKKNHGPVPEIPDDPVVILEALHRGAAGSAETILVMTEFLEEIAEQLEPRSKDIAADLIQQQSRLVPRPCGRLGSELRVKY